MDSTDQDASAVVAPADDGPANVQRATAGVKAASLSVVIMTFRRDARLLAGLLNTLGRQTLPPAEIVVVDANAEERFTQATRGVVAKCPIARVVHAPRSNFNMSWGMNVGIKRTAETSEYVMTTGMEMLFSPRAIETLMARMTPQRIGLAPCGFLPEGIDAGGDVWARWAALKAAVPQFYTSRIATGTLICVTRAWWHKVRGYDETRHPFNYTDADVAMRAKMDGLVRVVLPWEKAQVLHPWHPLSEYYYGVSSGFPKAEYGLIRNPGGWGEIE